MNSKTLEQLSVAIRIVPRLSKVQYAGIMGVLKAYYGHAGRPGMVGGSMPRHGGIMPSLGGVGGGDSSSINPPGSDYDDNEALRRWFDNYPGIDDLTAEQSYNLGFYTVIGYENINAALRGEKITAPAKVITKAIEEIDGALEGKVLGEDITLYRGMSLRNNIEDYFQSDGTYTDSAFISTSTNPEIAEGFFKGRPSQNVILIIKAKKDTKGMPVRKTSQMPGEDEVLLDRNTRFKVKDMIFRPATRDVPEHVEVTLEPISGGTSLPRSGASLPRSGASSPKSGSAKSPKSGASSSIMRLVKGNWGTLMHVTTPDYVALMRKTGQLGHLSNYDDQHIFEAIQQHANELW